MKTLRWTLSLIALFVVCLLTPSSALALPHLVCNADRTVCHSTHRYVADSARKQHHAETRRRYRHDPKEVLV